MATEVKLPRLGQGMESGTIVKWLKGEGDPVKKREPLYELDTDKVTQEVEAEADGVLLKIVVDSGEVEVGRTIAFIGSEGEDVPSGNGAAPSGAAATRPRPRRTTRPRPPRTRRRRARRRLRWTRSASAARRPPPRPRQPRLPPRRRGPTAASRRLRSHGGSPARRESTSRRSPARGRKAGSSRRTSSRPPLAPPAAAPAAALPAAGEVEELELTSTRKTIARRLTEAWQAPVFQLTVSADMTRTLELRERLVDRLAEGETKPTVSDLLTKVVGAALVRHTPVNAHFTGETIRRFPSAHVGIAVAAPNGLIVPVIRDADRRTIQEIAAARADLVGRARDGKLQRADLEDGTFTISNLGMFGMEQFVAVLNPPQAAILAVGSTVETPVVRDGEIVVRPMLTLTLTCDHRAIDGADGADFLRTVKELLEEPALAL